jgi:hypothetical protein
MVSHGSSSVLALPPIDRASLSLFGDEIIRCTATEIGRLILNGSKPMQRYVRDPPDCGDSRAVRVASERCSANGQSSRRLNSLQHRGTVAWAKCRRESRPVQLCLFLDVLGAIAKVQQVTSDILIGEVTVPAGGGVIGCHQVCPGREWTQRTRDRAALNWATELTFEVCPSAN